MAFLYTTVNNFGYFSYYLIKHHYDRPYIKRTMRVTHRSILFAYCSFLFFKKMNDAPTRELITAIVTIITMLLSGAL